MASANRDFEPGVRFNKFIVKNGRVFEDLEVPLANQGIVSVLGKNGAGKSTIWNLFQATLLNATPYGHKKDELVKNADDASFKLDFDKAKSNYFIDFARKKKKWGYEILKDGEDQTPHTYNEAVKAAGAILGLTQAEFEGSIHLTQGAQHILISGKPAKRKEYISNFFGIDTSYDLVHQEAKAKLQATKEEITKLSALSHTKTMLEQEIELEQYQDTETFEEVLEGYEQKIKLANLEIDVLGYKKAQHANYDKYSGKALKYEDPKEDLTEAEELLIRLTSKVMSAKDILKANKTAREINKTIDTLENENTKLLLRFPNLQEVCLTDIKEEIEVQVKTKNANQTVQPLRDELAELPELKALPIEPIEEEVTKVKVDHQTYKRKLASIQNGQCSECGSEFDSGHVEEVEAKVKELRETYEILHEDLEVIRGRNAKANRRENILKTVQDIPQWTSAMELELVTLKALVPSKQTYTENIDTLKILKRAEIQEEVDTASLNTKIEAIKTKIEDYKACIVAKEKLPEKPDETIEAIETSLARYQKNLKELFEKKSDTEQTLGKIKAANQRIKRLQKELTELTKKLSKIESLKKTEFFWAKMVDAYGPRGLRVRQLEKMMNLVIRRLPVYTSILFNEKGLTFKHKCDASSVEIIACREEIDSDTGEKVTFEHDISSFSGGEKGKMSTAFVLTLADCVPPAKRSNILILDEVDSALDEDGQFRFTNDLLPMLKESYESVFVVSHSQEIQQAAVYDQVWTVKKENHRSIIDKGVGDE